MLISSTYQDHSQYHGRFHRGRRSGQWSEAAETTQRKGRTDIGRTSMRSGEHNAVTDALYQATPTRSQLYPHGSILNSESETLRHKIWISARGIESTRTKARQMAAILRRNGHQTTHKHERGKVDSIGEYKADRAGANEQQECEYDRIGVTMGH